MLENHMNGCQIFGQFHLKKNKSETIFGFLHTHNLNLNII